MGATALCCFSCFGVSESVTNEMPAKAPPRTGCSCQMLSCPAEPQLPDCMEGSRVQPGPGDAVDQEATYPHSSEQHSELLDFTPSQRKALCGTFSQK